CESAVVLDVGLVHQRRVRGETLDVGLAGQFGDGREVRPIRKKLDPQAIEQWHQIASSGGIEHLPRSLTPTHALGEATAGTRQMIWLASRSEPTIQSGCGAGRSRYFSARTQIVRQPARWPASMSRHRSPTMKDWVRLTDQRRAASSSIPGLGLRQAQ